MLKNHDHHQTGQDLKRTRERSGASLRDVARAAHVSPSTVLRWESQSTLPKASTGALKNIMIALGVRKL